MKTCPHCGAPLPDGASFCHNCARAVNARSRVSPPWHMPRRVLYSTLLIVLVLALAVGGWLYTRPKVYDNGTAEVIYTDQDGTYQILAGYGTDRFEPVHEYTTECEEREEYRMPSRLYINHQESGANAKEVFIRKVEAVTVDVIQSDDSPIPWRWSEPKAMSFAPDAAMISLLDFTAQSGPMELIWTIHMENGDIIRLYQKVELIPIPTYHYYPEDTPMETAEELQTLVDKIGAEVEEAAIVYIHLPPVTYTGGLTIEQCSVNLIGSTDEKGRRTTFTSTVRLSSTLDNIVYFDDIDFVGNRNSIGISAASRLHLTGCSLSGWKTGLLGYGYAWVNADECVFEDNLVGFHFNATGGYVSDRSYLDNVFRNNGTAVLLEQVPTDTDLIFGGTRFSGNGTDIDNRCGQALDISKAIFE